MKVKLLLYTCTLFMVYSTAERNCDDLKLEQVQVLHRHGARTPIENGLKLFNDTDYSVYESTGFLELTPQGKRQLYNFGKFLRYRYSNFLNSTYKSSEVYAYSSDISRTKMSLQLLLAGLYPPDQNTKWDPALNWSPIPYSYAPESLDILLSSFKNIKFLLMYVKTLIPSKQFRTTVKKYSEFFEFVAKNTDGKKIPNVVIALKNSITAFDVLISKEYMNLPVPAWYTPKVKQTFIEMMADILDSTALTTQLKRHGIGFLIKTYIENMNLHGAIENPRKIYVYAGHDMTIGMFTRTHGIRQFRYPYFGSAVIFEKLRDSRNQVYVRLFSWDGLGNLEALKLGNGFICSPIDDYLKIVKPFIPSAKEMDYLIGDLNAKEIKDLFFNSVNRPENFFQLF